MTRLAGVRLQVVRLRFREPARFGATTVSGRDAGIVRASTEDGHQGLGEIAGLVVDRSVVGLATEAGEALGGVDAADPAALDASLQGLPETAAGRHVRAALECAALDAAGRACGRSVAELLGGGAAGIAVNGLLTIGLGDAGAAAADARVLVDRGFGTIKLKRRVGGRPIEPDLQAIREAVGPRVALRLDLNGDLSERDAAAWLSTLAWAGLEYVEQPISPALGPAALARVRAASPMPVAADEAVTGPEAAAELLEAGACDVVVVKPARVGGPRRAHRIAGLAAAAGVGVTISTLYETGIGLAAALQVAATVSGGRAHGLATGGLLEDDPVRGWPAVEGGRVAMPSDPGLGVTLDEAALARWVTP